jgi:predicted DNA-binding WGR domain protein
MREFRQTHGRSGERYWSISFEAPPGQPPEVIVTKWGSIKEGAKKQHGETKDRPGPKGKTGTKAFMSASDNACFNMDRLIRRKVEEGYVEVGLDGRPLIGGVVEKPEYTVLPLYAEGDVIDFSKALPKNMCFSKPKNTVSEKFIAKLEADDNLILTRKVNGMMVICQVTDSGAPRLYTRRMDEITNHFPHLLEALSTMEFPAKSILLFEAFMGEGNEKRDLLRVQSIMRSKYERAIQLQEDDGWMKFYLIRVPVWKGEYLEQTRTCSELCLMIENTFTDRFMDYRRSSTKDRFLFTLENFEGSVAEARAEAERNGYEGWVGYKKNATFGKYSFSFHGKPDRPSCCFKMKAEYEDDFIAYFDPEHGLKEFPMGSWGSGKNTGLLGTLSLYQMDTTTNGQVYVCEVGSGFTDKQRKEMTEAEYPMVVTVKYTSRQYISEGYATNALEFPRFDQIHPDKEYTEVYNPKIQSG